MRVTSVFIALSYVNTKNLPCQSFMASTINTASTEIFLNEIFRFIQIKTRVLFRPNYYLSIP